MPICFSYLTNTMPIIGGGGVVWPAPFLPMPIENTGCHSSYIYADILIFANANVANFLLKLPQEGASFMGK